MKVFYDKDCDLGLIKDKHVGIIGFGSQGHAHALNLRDSGIQVSVGLRKSGESWKKAEATGLDVVEVDELASLVAWLASEENSFSTGAVFDLSGGRATY